MLGILDHSKIRGRDAIKYSSILGNQKMEKDTKIAGATNKLSEVEKKKAIELMNKLKQILNDDGAP